MQSLGSTIRQRIVCKSVITAFTSSTKSLNETENFVTDKIAECSFPYDVDLVNFANTTKTLNYATHPHLTLTPAMSVDK